MIDSRTRAWSRASNMRRRRTTLRAWSNVPPPDPQLSFGAALSLDRGLELKASGMARAETRALSFVQPLRAAAKAWAVEHGEITADDVRRLAAQLGLVPPNKNCWGPIFSERGWRIVGYSASTTRTNHAHRNPVWAWFGDAEAGTTTSDRAGDDDFGGAA